MTFDEYIDKHNGFGVDVDNYPKDALFQCMDNMHLFCVEVLGLSDLRILAAPVAKDVWLTNVFGKEMFESIANTPMGVPQKGDILLWGTGLGPYGHVAVFVEGDANRFKSFDQNFPLNSKCHIQEHTYKGLLGWLRIKDQEKTVTLPQKEVDEMRKRRDELYVQNQDLLRKEGEYQKESLKLQEDIQTCKLQLGDALKVANQANEIDLNVVGTGLDAQHARDSLQQEMDVIKQSLGLSLDNSNEQVVEEIIKLKEPSDKGVDQLLEATEELYKNTKPFKWNFKKVVSLIWNLLLRKTK